MAGRKAAKHGTLMGLTQARTAELLDVSTATISTWVRAGKIRTLPDGSVDPADPMLTGKQGATAKGKKASSAKVLSYHDARARVESLKAEKLKLEIDAQRGLFVDKQEVINTSTAIGSHLREGIDNAVERASGAVAARFGVPEPAVRTLLADHFHETLEIMADELEIAIDAWS